MPKNEFQSINNFDQLYSLIRSLKIHGIGPLAMYDTAHRIGKHLNIHPQRVYLQSEAKIRAEKLLGGKIKSRTIEKSEFEMLSDFTCEEIEDILCLTKGGLTDISRLEYSCNSNRNKC